MFFQKMCIIITNDLEPELYLLENFVSGERVIFSLGINFEVENSAVNEYLSDKIHS